MKNTILSLLVGTGIFSLTSHAIAQNLYVGSNSSGETVDFTDGTNSYSNTYVGDPGTLTYSQSYYYKTTASNNLLNVINTNTLLINSNNIYVGNVGEGNRLIISNGGYVVNQGGYIGCYPMGYNHNTNGTSNNSVLVTGTGSLWSNNVVCIGYSGGYSNSLVISNGGSVISYGVYIYSTNNSVLVSGLNSSLRNRQNLSIMGIGNSLVLSNGGSAYNNGGWVGSAGSKSNSVIVTGSQSIWTCYAFAIIGGQGRDNSLVISNGGRVRSSGASIGSLGSVSGDGGIGSNNSALVTGTNSRWTNTGWLYIGGGIGNSLIVSNGGTIINSNGCIGNDSTSVNNYVLVEGSNSLWTNSGDVTIGYAGDGTLTVANGGTVAATGGITIASQSGSTGTLNIGAVGGNDNVGAIIVPTITFGSGSGTINFNQRDGMTLTSSISGAGALNQIGTGTTILTGSNNYTGTTTIISGTLLANNTEGSAVGSSSVTVQGSGTLGGNGTIGGATTITSGGNLTPGSSGTGALTFTQGLALQSGSTTAFQINTSADFTSINILGNSITYDGDLVFNILNYTPAAGDAFTLFNMTGGATESGDFNSVTAGSLSFIDNSGIWSANDGSYLYQFSDSTGQLTVQTAPPGAVPEPSTYALFGIGAIGMLMVLRRKKTA